MSQPELLASILALALDDADLPIEGAGLVVTDHAVQRYRERVEGVAPRRAVHRLRQFAESARWRSRPQAWTRVLLHPGVVYGYSRAYPGVCLLVRSGAVVTVVTRRMFAEPLAPAPRDRVRDRPRRQHPHRIGERAVRVLRGQMRSAPDGRGHRPSGQHVRARHESRRQLRRELSGKPCSSRSAR